MLFCFELYRKILNVKFSSHFVKTFCFVSLKEEYIQTTNDTTEVIYYKNRDIDRCQSCLLSTSSLELRT